MNYLKTLAVICAALCCQLARADTSYDFVRIACVPETGMLDVEYRMLHDTVAGKDTPGRTQKIEALARNGFHDPRALQFKCMLNGVNYLVSATQDRPSNGMCGGSPDIVLNVARNGVRLFKDVIFGNSCRREPSVRRLMLAEPVMARGEREANICYSNGDENAAEQCQWIFDSADAFRKAFPIDQDAVGRYLKLQKQ